jgi:hypothetical protein
VHTPLLQVCPLVQARPHMPQLEVEVDKLTSQPSEASRLQSAKPVSHVKRQALEVQEGTEFARVGHAVPHVPQFVTSDVVLTQVVPHLVSPPLQTSEQVPATHISPLAHVFPQKPQLLTSVCRLRHTPEHSVVGDAHETLQVPETQASVPAQALPHVPQLARSVWRFAQVVVPPEVQVVSGAVHVDEHRPRLQTWPEGHALPHTPQFSGSFVRLTHSPPHLVCPVVHAPLASPVSFEPVSPLPPSGSAPPSGRLKPPPPVEAEHAAMVVSAPSARIERKPKLVITNAYTEPRPTGSGP